MKKQLLFIAIFLGSCFFVSAQATDLSDINVGVSGTIDGVSFSVGNGTQYQGILGLIALAQTIVARLAPLLIGLAILAFFWFIILFIWKGGENPEVRSKMQTGMVWSVVAIFVMVSIWGLVSFIGNILGISQGGGMTGFRLPGQ